MDITNNEIDVINVNGHYEAYLNNEFICSGDTYNECYQEAKNITKSE